MQLEQIQTFFDTSPAVRLLRSEKNAPYIIDFLNLTFKKNSTLAIAHEDLRLELLMYLEALHERYPDALGGEVDRYLTSWSDAGWLNRHLESSSTQPQYQLTRHTEDALQFVDLLISRRKGMVGTESRLRLIIDTLVDLVQGASDDRAQRLVYLEKQKAELQLEIDALQTGKPVDVYQPATVRERFQMAVGLLKTLQNDFRAVEEQFHDIARGVQQGQQASISTRGQILGNAMDAEDLLKTEDEGISFYAFIAFLFSPDGQHSLRETIDQVIRLEAVQGDHDSILRLRNMVKSLLQEADKVLNTNGRLSTSLRKLLDADAAEDRRQTAEVIRDIKQLVCQLRGDPPTDSLGSSLQSTEGPVSPFSRTFWNTPQTFDSQPEKHVVDLEKASHQRDVLAALEMLDLDQLRNQVRRAMAGQRSMTMPELIGRCPPESGVLELVGYFQIAFDDGHSINRNTHEIVALQNAKAGTSMKVKIPKITFYSDERQGVEATEKVKPK